MARQVLTYPDLPAVLTQAAADARYYPLTSAQGADPFPQYLIQTEGDARYLQPGAAGDPLPQYQTSAEVDTAVTAAINAHLAAGDPHPAYLTQTEGDARYYPLTAAQGADPFPQYLTQAEGDARYPLANATDPYPVYYNQTRGDARYLQAATAASTYLTQANATSTYVPLTGGSVMTGALGPTTTNTRDLGTSALRWRKDYLVDGDYSGSVVIATALTVATKNVALSPNANQTLQWLANGFYSDSPTKAQYDALVARVALLEGQMGAGANGHYHLMGTWRQTLKATIPATVLEEAPAA